MGHFMVDKLLTFEDLEFKPHKGIPGGIHSVITFENGYSLSIVGGGTNNMLYGDGVNTFEAWASCDEYPRTYISKQEVTEYMRSVQLIKDYEDPFPI
jgi:hypothetical protein